MPLPSVIAAVATGGAAVSTNVVVAVDAEFFCSPPPHAASVTTTAAAMAMEAMDVMLRGDRWICTLLYRSGCLVHESFDLDDHPGDLASGDEAALVVDRHGEREAATFDVFEHRFGRHLVTNGGWSEVIDLDPHPNGGEPRRQPIRDRRNGSLLTQGDDTRGAEYRHAARSVSDCGVDIGDDPACLAAESGFDGDSHRSEVTHWLAVASASDTAVQATGRHA